MKKRGEACEVYMDQMRKELPGGAPAILKHAFKEGWDSGQHDGIENLVSAMTKLLEPEMMEFIEKSIVRKGLQSGNYEIFCSTDSKGEPK